MDGWKPGKSTIFRAGLSRNDSGILASGVGWCTHDGCDSIRSGLRSLDAENMHIFVIEETRFDADTGTWTIQMRDAKAANEGQVVHVTVNDEEQVKIQGGE